VRHKKGFWRGDGTHGHKRRPPQPVRKVKKNEGGEVKVAGGPKEGDPPKKEKTDKKD